MKTRHRSAAFPFAFPALALVCWLLTLSVPALLLAAAAPKSDLAPAAKRQTTLEMAERLARPRLPAPLPTELLSPFSPPDFDKADASDAATGPAAAAAASAGVAPPAGPASDRETLGTLANQILPSGVIEMRGRSLLMINGRAFEVGTRFTATYNHKDYELELVAIDRTTFTLRFRSEEITRPIKPVR